LPEFREADESVYRRIYIIKFDKKFTDEEVNKFDKSKIFTPDAINYFANIALREYLKIKNTRKLANREESNRLLEQCKNANDSINDITTKIMIKGLVKNHLYRFFARSPF